MAVRKRTRMGKPVRGEMDYFGVGKYRSDYINLNEVCEDVIGNYMGQNPFFLERFYYNYPTFDGTIPNLLKVSSYASGYRPAISHIPIFIGLFRDPTQAIASAHPGEPGISIPNFLYEMKDIPSLLRQAAERARALHNIWHHRGWRVSHARLRAYYTKRRAGEDWLMYHFGWAPFWGDIEDIAKLDDYLQKRKDRHKRIRDSELRVSGTLGEVKEKSTTTGVSFNSFGFGATGTVYKSTVRQRWFSARYTIDPIRFTAELDPSKRADLLSMLGVGRDLPIQIWNAIPWTWLADWFTNVGSIISLAGNRQGLKFKDAVIMDRTRTDESHNVTSKPKQLTSRDGGRLRETKQRFLFSPTFVRQDAGYNIFQPPHLATLASLRVTKFSKSSSF